MKDIEDMNLSELADDLTTLPSCSVRPYVLDTIDRLRVIHEETRWIPVSERMPTHEDGGLNNKVLVLEVENASPRNKYIALVDWFEVGKPDYFYTTTHWRRIDLPEANP
jgi:hypothetical protein